MSAANCHRGALAESGDVNLSRVSFVHIKVGLSQ